MNDPRRGLPSVSALLDLPGVTPLLDRYARSTVVEAAREAVATARTAHTTPAGGDEWAARVTAATERRNAPSLRPLFNATGVVLHTNLGRAPLAAAAIAAIGEAADGFCNLEYDVDRGARGSRYDHCAALLRELTGAPAALVVNNCAAALVLALGTVASGRGAAVSRGELVEIGGSFRVPEIMAKSGARLVEVGSTNRTHASDYARALDDASADVAAVVKVHRSNFSIDGYVADVSATALARLAGERDVAFVHDFGSGLMLALDAYGLAGELTAADAVAACAGAGRRLVVMSGDKLLGGPQAGIMLGDATTIASVAANPLARALRVDKLTIAALGATLAIYRDPARAVREVPALAMLSAPAEQVGERARSLAAVLAPLGIECSVVPSEATVGGGAFPGARIPSFALRLPGSDAERRLRGGRVPVIGRVGEGATLLDLRSVPAAHDARFAAAVVEALA